MRHLIAAALLALCFACPALADVPEQVWLQDLVDSTRTEKGVTALGAVIETGQGEERVAVSGETVKGSGDPVETGDAWHIGSNTKALTALLYARLVDEGLAEWGATLPELFPDLAADMDAAWQDVTIEDLFAHRSGIGGLGPFWLMSRHADKAPLMEQRLETTRDTLTAPPEGTKGEFSYQNMNYIIAGAAIEQLLDMTWEDAFRTYLIAPEGSTWNEGWGFGPPQEGLQGHGTGMFGGLKAKGRGPAADNPAALGPAGTAHVPLAGHARLLAQFLRSDSTFLPVETRDILLTPRSDDKASYALGWGVSQTPGAGLTYSHAGSNTMWLSRAMIAPDLDAVIIVNTNQYDEAADDATRQVVDAIIQKLGVQTD